MRLSGLFLQKPEFLSLSRDRVHVSGMEHVYYIVPPMKKDRSLVKIIEAENPVSALIFCNMKSTVHYVSVVLQRFGYDADELSADLTQAAREHVMARIKKGELRFLVATDVAARGIDIPDLSHVIQYEPGEDPESYIHRAGRTGRAGAGGTAITLVAGLEEIKLKEVASQYTIDLQERPLPTDDDVANIVAQRVTAMLEAELRGRDTLHVERMRRFVPLARSLGQIEDESGLVAMLLDDYYQKIAQQSAPGHRPRRGPPVLKAGAAVTAPAAGPRPRRRPVRLAQKASAQAKVMPPGRRAFAASRPAPPVPSNAEPPPFGIRAPPGVKSSKGIFRLPACFSFCGGEPGTQWNVSWECGTGPVLSRAGHRHQEAASMYRLCTFLGSFIGGTVGWYIGDIVGFATAVMATVLGSAIGIYFGWRIARDYLV